MEQYVIIQDYPNYMVSNLGNVKNIKTGKILKVTLDKSVGYFVLNLYNDDGVKKHFLHRLIAKYFIPNPDHYNYVDHFDLNKTNNKVENLRWCSQSMNIANQKPRKRSSEYKGVYFHKKSEKWCARLMKDYKGIHLGLFENEVDAAHAYNEKAKELFGEFALLNKVED